jgi:hypothetical protein
MWSLRTIVTSALLVLFVIGVVIWEVCASRVTPPLGERITLADKSDGGKTSLVTTVPKPSEHDIQLPWPDGKVVIDPGGNDRPFDLGCMGKGNSRLSAAYQDTLKDAGLLLSDGAPADAGPGAGLDPAVVNALRAKALDWTAACIDLGSACHEVTFPP